MNGVKQSLASFLGTSGTGKQSKNDLHDMYGCLIYHIFRANAYQTAMVEEQLGAFESRFDTEDKAASVRIRKFFRSVGLRTWQ